MATKSRKSARKSGRSTTRGSTARGKTRPGARKSAARKGGMKKPARKGGAKKTAMKKSARKASSRSASRGGSKAGRGQSAVARVKRVAREVAQQASAAVSSGVENIREFGENLVERVRED